jgi:hypothetical protein
MTQYSFPWPCGTTGDQGNITEAKMLWMNRLSHGGENGVIWWEHSDVPPAFDTGISFANAVDDRLRPLENGTNVDIESGIAHINGRYYVSDETETFAMATGNVSATDLIVVRLDVTLATIRLARVQGATSSVATLTQNSTTWEEEICRVTFDGSGNYDSMLDTRKLAYPPGTELEMYNLSNPSSGTNYTVRYPFSRYKLLWKLRNTNSGNTSSVTDAQLPYVRIANATGITTVRHAT